MNSKNFKNKSQNKSQRQLQIGEQIKRILADIFIKENISEKLGAYITILEADISPDAKNAKIFYNLFGNFDENTEKQIQKNLEILTPNIRAKIAREINLRFTPNVAFVNDKTAKNAARIEELLNDFPKS